MKVGGFHVEVATGNQIDMNSCLPEKVLNRLYALREHAADEGL